jgi:hypothetical protein
MMPIRRQRASAAATQRRFATLARKEGDYHLKQAARDHTQGNPVLENFHRAEASRCFYWATKRNRSAGQFRRTR